MAKRIDKADHIFAEALGMADPKQRAAYLQEACGMDESLRHEVESLLSAHDRAGAFLDNPVPGASFEIPNANGGEEARGDREKPGDRIGRYKLLERIGEGGFGVVWMAEQEEPVNRRVAVKVIKVGMDTKQVIARFEAERQALALMDHPNIAKVLDAGASESGRPYFVMELVRGIKITDFCDHNQVPTEQRLKLFMQVCQAIQHAHQKGVIHRDLKPSNILVTINDGVAVPKVIDFGIAKATQGRLTNQTLFTAFEQFLGTPAYMSPEQAVMTSLDVDTRSDIYSLGVLLYELLTGKTPFEQEDLLAAGLNEMRRTICEKEPVRPSTRLSTMAADALTALAKQHHTDAPKLIHTLRGDLDWIVMKCLEKSRAHRYETANGLALDIERHLNNEPVVARPPSKIYKLQKTFQRNKIVFAAVAGIGLVLVAGVIFSTFQAFRAIRAERKSDQVAQFLKDVLAAAGPSVAASKETRVLRDVLDKTAKRLDKDLKNQPEAEAEIRLIIAKTYHDLGRYGDAEAMVRKALQLRIQHFGREHLKVTEALDSLASILYEKSDFAGAEEPSRKALALREKLLGPDHIEVAASLNTLANLLQTRNELAEAERMHRRALAIRQKVLGADHVDVAVSLNNLANVLLCRGDMAEAEPLYRTALTIFRRLGEQHPIVAVVAFNQGIAIARLGDLAAAEQLHRDVLKLRRTQLGNGHPNVAVSLNELAVVLAEQGKLNEALECVLEAGTNQWLGAENWRFTTTLNTRGIVLSKMGRFAEAESSYRKALEGRQKLLGKEHPTTAETLGQLGVLLASRDDLAQGAQMLREALFIKQKTLSQDHPDVITPQWQLAWVLRQQGQPEADSLHHEAVSLGSRRGVFRLWTLIDAMYEVTDLLQVQKKFPEAEPLLLEALNHAQNGRNPLLQHTAIERLIRLYENWQKPARAAELKTKLAELDRTTAVMKTSDPSNKIPGTNK